MVQQHDLCMEQEQVAFRRDGGFLWGIRNKGGLLLLLYPWSSCFTFIPVLLGAFFPTFVDRVFEQNRDYLG